MAAGKAKLIDGTEVELVSAANNFKVWKEKGSNRILNANGMWSSRDDWQALWKLAIGQGLSLMAATTIMTTSSL
jgi:hypothetical protein